MRGGNVQEMELETKRSCLWVAGSEEEEQEVQITAIAEKVIIPQEEEIIAAPHKIKR